jgi:hypothetical protein
MHMALHRSQRVRLVRFHEAVVLIVCALVGILAMSADMSVRAPISSAETRFVETSSSGLLIVPASCPSSPPHFVGDTGTPNCGNGDVVPPPSAPSGGGCTISANPSNVSASGNSTLSWSVADQSLVLGQTSSPTNIAITGVGPVGRSGSTMVSLSQSTTYTLTGTYLYFGVQTGSFSCSATINVDGACLEGYVLQGGQCVWICPAGQHAVGNLCICDATDTPPNSAGLCTEQVCPPGFQYDATSGQCVSVSQCTLSPVCADETRVLNQCTGITSNCTANGPGWFCAAGQCVPPGPPVASISAVPSLVRPGASSNIAWTSQNTTSCTVYGNNGDGGDGWDGTTGSHASSAIVSQVVYTLVCEGLNGSTITRTATVNIIPNWVED